MAQLFQRRCVVIVDSLRVEGLRCVFKVSKSLAGEPNTCDLKITNLSETSRSQMQKRHAKVILAAGYTDTSAVIFSGDARTVDHVREGPDWTTHIQCGDGEKSFTLARFAKSYKAGTPVARVALDAANALGLGTGNLEATLKGVTARFDHGYTAHGRAAEELKRALAAAGLAFSVQDGSIQVLRAGQALPGTAVLLSPSTGLVGSPDHGTPDQKGGPAVLKAKSLLQPTIRVGGHVTFDSLAVKGQFLVRKLVHDGDTAGGPWYTEIEATPG